MSVIEELRQKICLPSFRLTELCDKADEKAERISIQRDGKNSSYYVKQINSHYGASCFNFFPIVLNAASAPWDLAMLYILSRIEECTQFKSSSINRLADDLGSFRSWLDAHENPDEIFIGFGRNKQKRATYRYQAFLKMTISSADISSSTAKRRMSTVVAFYRWLIKENFFLPEYAPWEDRSYSLSLRTNYGGTVRKSIQGTDLNIKNSNIKDPFSEFIEDGGKLRPLNAKEQEWIIRAADKLGNVEMYLIVLFMLLTGARIQTVLTLKPEFFLNIQQRYSQGLGANEEVLRLKIGPGANADAKNDKPTILHIPRYLHEMLYRYFHSERATRRRMKAPPHIAGMYVFLTQQGNPYYSSKKELSVFDQSITRRHTKVGGTVRQFMKDHLIPYIRDNFDRSFSFRLHDLRASFGMNQTATHMALVDRGKITLHTARQNVMILMGHSSAATTDLYLNYRRNNDYVKSAVEEYGLQLKKWIDNPRGINLDAEEDAQR